MDNKPFSISAQANETLKSYRLTVAESVVGAYGALREYAQLLNNVFQSAPRAWYLVEAKETDAFAQLIHAEKQQLFSALNTIAEARTGAKHSNPSTIWARARAYAKQMDEQAQNKGEGEGSGEGSGETGQTQERRSLLLRTVEEATKLWKAYEREAQFLDDAAKARQLKLVELIEACGIKRDSLKV
jgi:hypothetical protein